MCIFKRLFAKKLGFSLIEMAFIVVIVGLVAGATFSINSSKQTNVKYTVTKDRITAVMSSLNRYYANNSRLPCPAPLTSKIGDSTYGVQILTGSCDNNTAATGTTIIGAAGSPSTYVRIGAIPTRTLGLPDSMMYDEYGDKFTYILTAAFSSGITNGIITVNGVSPTLTNIVFAVISHGKDGKGAYTRSGATRVACGASTNLDVENCNGDATLTSTQFSDDSTSAATYFDDVIQYEDKYTLSNTAAP